MKRMAFIAALGGLFATSAQAQIITQSAPIVTTGVFGCATATGTSATQVIAAAGAGIKIYVTNISVTNSGATNASTVTVQTDTAGSPTTLWVTMNPTTGGSNPASFPPGVLYGVANKNVGFTAGTGSTTQTVCIAGYTAP